MRIETEDSESMEKERDNTTEHSITRRRIAISQFVRYSRGETRGALYLLRHPLKCLTELGLVRWT